MKNLNLQILTFCLLFLSIFSLIGQENYKKGEFIVQLKKGESIKQFIEDQQDFRGANSSMKLVKRIAPDLDIYLVAFDEEKVEGPSYLVYLTRQKSVQRIQRNHIVKLRATEPNDPEFSKQWQYINDGSNNGTVGADLDAEEAWDITTGGVTYFGDTIVVCVIDDGIDWDHEDFEDNLWVNRQEIPGNGVDDDGNGYIDDVKGWDADNTSGSMNGDGWHGTPVAGIIGAKGNNGKGVAGVNWNVKLMIVQGGGDEAQALAAYAYPLKMRKLYNQTNGAKGAFVVATNSSWGVDGGKAVDAPIWCAIYDSLGKYGVLNAGATANNNINVDSEGDLPTQCASEFLIGVTNIDNSDTKVTDAAYSITHVDLGAFGEGTWTTAVNGGYDGFGGTSGATPHVAGTIALLFSAQCPSFANLAKDDPEAAAALARRYILEGVDANNSLVGKTVTEGRLNMVNSLQLLMDECSYNGCFKPMNVRHENITTSSFKISWKEADSVAYFFAYRDKANSDTTWITDSLTTNYFELTGLSACQSFEYKIRTLCDTSNSAFTDVQTIKTDGCCEAPDGLLAESITDTTATIIFNEVTAANSYVLYFKEASTSNWDSVALADTTYSLVNLAVCTEYEYKVATICSGERTPSGDTKTFTTTCGICVSSDYCEITNSSSESEWIASVKIGDVTYTSTSNYSGYENHTSKSFAFETGKSYSVEITPGFEWGAYAELYRVWIDFNQDGDFDDAGELVFEPTATTQSTESGTITIPSSGVLAGSTRMRVSMKYQENGIEAQEPCGSIEYGEVEDYCVSLSVAGSTEEKVVNNFTSKIFPNPSNNYFEITLNPSVSNTIQVMDAFGKVILTKEVEGLSRTRLGLDTELPKGTYFVKIMNEYSVQTETLIKL